MKEIWYLGNERNILLNYSSLNGWVDSIGTLPYPK